MNNSVTSIGVQKYKMLETGQCGDVVWCKLGKITTTIKVLKLNQRQ